MTNILDQEVPKELALKQEGSAKKQQKKDII